MVDMTRELAIEILKDMKFDDNFENKALDMAIEALEQEPCDCITLRLKKGTLKYSDKDYVAYKKEWLKKWWQPELALLGIQPKPMQVELEGDGYANGKLVYDYGKCPKCGWQFEYGEKDWEEPYCCHCGQKLHWFESEEQE